MKNCIEPLQKQTKGVTFFSQNSQLTISIPKEKYFHVHDKNRPLLRKKRQTFLKNEITGVTFREKKKFTKEGYQGYSLTTDIRLQFGIVSREGFRCSGSFGLVQINNSFVTMIANLMLFHLIKVKNECVIRLVEPLPLQNFSFLSHFFRY